MGSLLCLTGSEKAIRIAVGRKLDALALFFKTFSYNLGAIQRGGGKGKEITSYGAFTTNRAVSWVQEQLANDPDTSNPIVAIDRYVSAGIALHIPKDSEAGRREKKRSNAPRGVCVPCLVKN
jgi:hypothetical protein